jgi:hypothetical protein
MIIKGSFLKIVHLEKMVWINKCSFLENDEFLKLFMIIKMIMISCKMVKI